MRLSEVISQLERIKDRLKEDPIVAVVITTDSNRIGFFPPFFDDDPVIRILGDKE